MEGGDAHRRAAQLELHVRGSRREHLLLVERDVARAAASEWRLAASLERELNVAVLDSVAVTLWRTLGLAGGDIGALADWGRIFQTSTVIK